MIKTITISRISRNEKTYNDKKTGQPKTFTSIGIQTSNSNDWINGADFDGKMADWKEGDEVRLDITKDPQWGWKFKLPSKLDELEERVAKLEKLVAEPKPVAKPITQSNLSPADELVQSIDDVEFN